MGRAHGIAIVTSIALGTTLWIVLADKQEPAPAWQPAPANRAASGAADTPPTPATTKPARRAAPLAEDEPSATHTTQPANGEPGSSKPDAPPASDAPFVSLRVFDLVTRRPVKTYRWTLRRAQLPPVHEVVAAGATANVDATIAGTLRIEADGYEPATRELRPVAEGGEAQWVEVFLAPAAVSTGVIVRARDVTGLPILRLRIDVWRIAPQATDPGPDQDPQTQPTLARYGSSPAGDYELPTLEGGRYWLRAQPVDDTDLPRPLQPARRAFTFYGNEQLPLDLVFQPGCVLHLEAQSEPAAAAELRCTVRSFDGRVRDVLWRNKTSEGQIVTRGSILLQQGSHSLLALPPVNWSLELQQGDTPVQVEMLPGREGVLRFQAQLPR
jgi:hypothetical protein